MTRPCIHSSGGIVIWFPSSPSNHQANKTTATTHHHRYQHTREHFLKNQMILVRGYNGQKNGNQNNHNNNPPAAALKPFKGYSFPKGHLEYHTCGTRLETELEATYREIYEESGVERDQLELVAKMGTIVKPEQQNRQVHLFLFRMKSILKQQQCNTTTNSDENDENSGSSVCVDESPPPLVPFLKDEIMEARWAEIGHALDGSVKLKSEMHDFLHENVDRCMHLFHDWLANEQKQQQQE